MANNKILKWALVLSIVIVANLFFNYTLSLVFNSPEYDQYCPFEKTSQVIETKQQCEQASGIWNPAKGIDKNISTGYCDLQSKCNNDYQKADKVYQQKVFIALVVIGVLILIISFLIKQNAVLGSALALTAVLDFLIATIRYWSYSDKLLKVGVLFIALLALIYLAIKKFKNINQ